MEPDKLQFTPQEDDFSDDELDSIIGDIDDEPSGSFDRFKQKGRHAAEAIGDKAVEIKNKALPATSEKIRQMGNLKEELLRGANATPTELYLYREYLYYLAKSGREMTLAERRAAARDERRFKEFVGGILERGASQHTLDELRKREMTPPGNILPEVYSSLQDDPEHDEPTITGALSKITQARAIGDLLRRGAAVPGLKVALLHVPHAFLMRGALFIVEKLAKRRKKIPDISKFDQEYLNKEIIGYLLFNDVQDPRVEKLSTEIVGYLSNLPDLISVGLNKVWRRKKK